MTTDKPVESAKIALLPTDSLTPHPGQGQFATLTEQEYAGLLASIANRGIQVPLCVNAKDQVLCGLHRLKAARELGILEVPAVVVACPSAEDELVHMAADNLNRRNLTPRQRAAIWFSPELASARAALEAQARARQVEGGKEGRKRGGKRQAGERLEAKMPQAEDLRNPQTRDVVAEAAGVSARTGDAIKKAWETSPDLMRAVAAGTSKEAVWAKAVGPGRQEKEGTPAASDGSSGEPGTILDVPLGVLEGGDIIAELLGVVPLGSRRRPELGIVWRVADGASDQPILIQRLPDDRDEEGWVAGQTQIGRFAAEIGECSTCGVTSLQLAVGQRFLLSVSVDHDGPTVTKVSRLGGDPPAGEVIRDLPGANPGPGFPEVRAPLEPGIGTTMAIPDAPADQAEENNDGEDPGPGPTDGEASDSQLPVATYQPGQALLACETPGCGRPAVGDTTYFARCASHKTLWDDGGGDQDADGGDTDG